MTESCFVFSQPRELQITQTQTRVPLIFLQCSFNSLKAVFCIVTFWYGSRSAPLTKTDLEPDPDRDPALFVSDLQDANKK
jgi:hypothetical protein